MSQEIYTLEGEIELRQDDAILFHIGDKYPWIPIENISIEELSGGMVIVSMPEWLAIEFELE